MGLDFLLAATELPPFPQNDDEANVIIAKITETLMDQEVLESLVCDKFYHLVESYPFDEISWDKMTADTDWNTVRKEVASHLERNLRGFWNGENSRSYAELNTYDKDGNKIVLTVSGEMSYGDVHESLDFLWEFEYLPNKWWI